MLNAIAKPFGWLMMTLYELTGSYGLAVILFGLIVKIILAPFQIKSKRSSIEMQRLQPRLKELEKKHGANKQKYNEEVQKLYREEKIKPMSGCIWSLIPFPILIALYQAIRQPITSMMGISKELLADGGALLERLVQIGYVVGDKKDGYAEITQTQLISANLDKFMDIPEIAEKFHPIDYNFLGMDLGMRPQLKFLWDGSASTPEEFMPLFGLLFIPLICCLLTYLSSKISMKMSGAEQQQQMGTMMIMMPLMTLYFAFIMPAALGVYWIASSLFAIVQDIILNAYYKKQFAIIDAERLEKEKEKAEELEAKRQETERLRAENKTVTNPNTSKRKQQVKEREIQREKAAEWDKIHNPKPVVEPTASQEGTRRYARGRAYDPNRYNTDGTAAAVAAETVEETAEETVETMPAIEAADEAVEVVETETAEDIIDEPSEDEADEVVEADEAEEYEEEPVEEDEEASDD